MTHTDVGGGTDSSAKLLTAAPRRRGAGRREYQTLPSLVVGDVATDIAQYVGDETRRAFTDSTWGLTTFNDAIYGVPQDVGPMARIYNQARFAELGITVPTTWAEFATAAEQVRKADPSTYIGTFSPEVFGFFAGMSSRRAPSGGMSTVRPGRPGSMTRHPEASPPTGRTWSIARRRCPNGRRATRLMPTSAVRESWSPVGHHARGASAGGGRIRRLDQLVRKGLDHSLASVPLTCLIDHVRND